MDLSEHNDLQVFHLSSCANFMFISYHISQRHSMLFISFSYFLIFLLLPHHPEKPTPPRKLGAEQRKLCSSEIIQDTPVNTDDATIWPTEQHTTPRYKHILVCPINVCLCFPLLLHFTLLTVVGILSHKPVALGWLRPMGVVCSGYVTG